MTVEYVKANLLDAPESVIAHGCNNKGVWGTGVAKAIKDRWPRVFNIFEYAHVSGGLGLGSVVWGPRNPAETAWVASVVTQHGYGKDPAIRYASYDAIDRGLRTLVDEALHRGRLEANGWIAVPQIGCGNGHADWSIVSAILAAVARHTGVRFKVYVPDGETHARLTRRGGE